MKGFSPWPGRVSTIILHCCYETVKSSLPVPSTCQNSLRPENRQFQWDVAQFSTDYLLKFESAIFIYDIHSLPVRDVNKQR